MLKTIILLTLSSLVLGFNGAPTYRAPQNSDQGPPVQNPQTNSGELKTLAEGSYSPITDPFVAVIRDVETYDQLRKLDSNLPSLEATYFQLNIVIAAFLGTRNTGGYSVAISLTQNNQIRVAEKAPPKGSMTAQVITSPFKVVSLASSGSSAVVLTLDDAFQHHRQLYRVSTGTFTVSGGFAGGTESFALNGKVQILRLGNLITLGTALVSSGGTRERSLRDSATGTIKDGKISISRISHGSLLDPPSGELEASGKFLEKNQLSLELFSKPINVPENYTGKGSILAELVAASRMN